MERGARSQVIGSVDGFARYLRGLVGAAGDTPGWYAVFAERDPEGVRAWLDGSDVPPWDVVLSLLQDAAAARGTHPEEAAAEPARRLHAAAVAAHDAAPGGEAALSTRLDALSRERRYAELHERDVTAALRVAATLAEAERLGNELAWARDDRERAVACCAELQVRLDAVRSRPVVPEGWFRPQTAPASRVPAPRAPAASPSPDEDAPAAAPGRGDDTAQPGTAYRPSARGRRQRPRGGARYGGARFAGAPEAEAAAAPVAPPVVAAPEGGAAPGPRGARFAGAAGREAPGTREAGQPRTDVREAHARREAARLAAARMAELRRTGRTGEAYVLMSEAVAGPPEDVPELAAALERSGLAADVATLLWELAAQPPRRLAAAATALDSAGRGDDRRTLLHQAAARPAAEVAATAGALLDAGHRDAALSLLAALVRARSPEAAAGIVREGAGLVGPLLDAAGLVSVSKRRDVAAALRRAGLPDREI
ncbi:hypothetical protein ABZZ36_03565 [Actinacidiphila glaucinigra]|uniref:hypothetical protein n=1 Tax=Actinacidiphila glaucinigra TaxID=235986 RepID=UPI0033A0BCEC